jgi:hypothetical protein
MHWIRQLRCAAKTPVAGRPATLRLEGRGGQETPTSEIANKALIIAESELTLLHVNGHDEGTPRGSDLQVYSSRNARSTWPRG